MPHASKFLFIDPVVEDRIYKVPQEKFGELFTRHELRANGKKALTKEAMNALLNDLADYVPYLAHGGSGGTMAFTLKRLFPEIDVRFVGVVGGTPFSEAIEASFRRTGIELLPGIASAHVAPHVAVSAMIMPEQGGRTIATYPGTFGQSVTRQVLTDELVKDRDVIHLLLTNRDRLGIAFVDDLLDLRWRHDKALWVNLPTYKDYAWENAEDIQRILTVANLVLGNMDELKWSYRTDDATTAIRMMQQAFKANVLSDNSKTQGQREPTAFITDDERTAYTITAENVWETAPKPVPKSEIVNNGGAGDTAFSGFVAGYIFRNLSPEVSMKIGHALAGRKLRQIEPSLENPGKTLMQYEPELAGQLFASEGCDEKSVDRASCA